MMFSDVIMLILEVIGSISFAVSGAFVAIKARLDIFGVVFIAAITAFGGGMLRDVLIGRVPPAVFRNFPVFAVAVASALIVFVIAYRNREKFDRIKGKIEPINNVFDAIGLAAFSVMGTEVAFQEGLADNMFLAVVLGMLTGVGGGMIRDILTDTTPYIFKKHVYALASILGSCLYYLLRRHADSVVLASAAAMLFIVTLRMLATKYRWSLPRIREENRKR